MEAGAHQAHTLSLIGVGGLDGLDAAVPIHVESLQERTIRACEVFKGNTANVERHIYLRQLQDSNEKLLYRLLRDHEHMLSIVYIPTVGLACKQFCQIYRRGRERRPK